MRLWKAIQSTRIKLRTRKLFSLPAPAVHSDFRYQDQVSGLEGAAETLWRLWVVYFIISFLFLCLIDSCHAFIQLIL